MRDNLRWNGGVTNGGGVSRAAFLRGSGALAIGIGGLVSTGAAAPEGRSGNRPAGADLDVTKIADLSGPGITTRFRMEATDLGVAVRTPDGRTLFVFGDTFEDACVGCGWWRSPVGLYGDTGDLNAGVRWASAVGGEVAEQLWDYEHDNPEYSTILPSDVITIGASMYLHAMANQGLGNVVWTGIWRSDDSGATWNQVAHFPADLHGGLFQLLTWAQGDDGFVYVYSTEFTRSKPIIVHRVPVDLITELDAYEPWGYRDGAWAWGNPPTPVLEGSFGELCLRPMAGKWVFTWFNEGDYRIDGIMMDTPTDDLYAAHRRTLLWGTSWGEEDDAHVAQLYGGYIIPGSTPADLHVAVSQWNTEQNWPYRVMQYRIRGFDQA